MHFQTIFYEFSGKVTKCQLVLTFTTSLPIICDNFNIRQFPVKNRKELQSKVIVNFCKILKELQKLLKVFCPTVLNSSLSRKVVKKIFETCSYLILSETLVGQIKGKSTLEWVFNCAIPGNKSQTSI